MEVGRRKRQTVVGEDDEKALLMRASKKRALADLRDAFYGGKRFVVLDQQKERFRLGRPGSGVIYFPVTVAKALRPGQVMTSSLIFSRAAKKMYDQMAAKHQVSETAHISSAPLLCCTRQPRQ
jgi:hypothetical protein